MKTLPDTLVVPARTITRSGAFSSLLKEGREFGDRCFLVYGAALERSGLLRDLVASAPAGMEVAGWRHPGGEPTLAQVEMALVELRRFEPDWVAAVGGGSVMDVAKACAGLANAEESVQAYHDGTPLPDAILPYVAVPTTAGTGSEATVVSVLINERTGVKKSFRHPSLMAGIVILAPELLGTCSPQVIAHSGMDAFVQAIESYSSRGATALTDLFALQGLGLIHASLPRVYGGARDLPLLADLLHGSFLTGCALSNARLGLVHGLAHPLGVRYHAAHGLVCAVCLPPVLEFNRPRMEAKYARLTEVLGCDPRQRTRALMSEMGIASPFAGQRLKDPDAVIDETLASGSTAANPRPVGREDVKKMLRTLFGGM